MLLSIGWSSSHPGFTPEHLPGYMGSSFSVLRVELAEDEVFSYSQAWYDDRSYLVVEIESADGATKIWEALEARFPKQTEANETGEALDSLFDTEPEREADQIAFGVEKPEQIAQREPQRESIIVADDEPE